LGLHGLELRPGGRRLGLGGFRLGLRWLRFGPRGLRPPARLRERVTFALGLPSALMTLPGRPATRHPSLTRGRLPRALPASVLAVEMTLGVLGRRLVLASGGVTIHDPLDPLAQAAQWTSMLLFARVPR